MFAVVRSDRICGGVSATRWTPLGLGEPADVGDLALSNFRSASVHCVPKLVFSIECALENNKTIVTAWV